MIRVEVESDGPNTALMISQSERSQLQALVAPRRLVTGAAAMRSAVSPVCTMNCGRGARPRMTVRGWRN
jgi:hypothetical protein